MFRSFLHSLAVISLTALPLAASELAAPTGDVLLTVTGNVAATNVDNRAELDLDMLRSLETVRIETSTIWTEGTQVFEGVPLGVLVAELGLQGKTLRATAINDYAVDIPMTDAVEGGATVAYLLNGAPMSVRDKGPLWIIYPYDDDADFRTEVIYSRSIWQLDRIEAID